MSDTSGPQQLSGHIIRDYDHAIVTLNASRISQRLTVTDVAARIPVDRGSVSRWLGGKECYSGRLFELAGALGYDVAFVPREDASRVEAHCDLCGGPCRDESEDA